MRSISELRERTNEVTAELLLADAEIAMTFLDLADTTRVPENRIRRRREAAKAYQTILKLLPRVDTTEEQKLTLKGRLDQIHRRLSK
ncbi:MAG: hypothetical protein JOZ33_07955 [Acidobacteriaceae bacterium]|nr:hypothetical protein [Acidobacteriaceae bacterium]